MDKYVFLKVLENQEQVMIDPEYVLTIFTACHMKTANQNTGEPLYTWQYCTQLSYLLLCLLHLLLATVFYDVG